MLYDKNLVDMSLRLNRSVPIFRTIREQRSIGRRRRTRDDMRFERNLSIDFMIYNKNEIKLFYLGYYQQ